METLEYFGSLGIQINELYGMSECTGATTVSLNDAHVWGSCGFPQVTTHALHIRCTGSCGFARVTVRVCVLGFRVDRSGSLLFVTCHFLLAFTNRCSRVKQLQTPAGRAFFFQLGFLPRCSSVSLVTYCGVSVAYYSVTFCYKLPTCRRARRSRFSRLTRKHSKPPRSRQHVPPTFSAPLKTSRARSASGAGERACLGFRV